MRPVRSSDRGAPIRYTGRGDMLDAPKGLRLHIGLFGRRNVGKSSLLNALAAQSVSIVSDTPGTTTDPVEKTLEFAPLGPVVFLDTAGLDDEGELGTQRTERTLAVLPRTDMALVVTAENVWGHYEETIVSRLSEQAIPFLVVMNKTESSVASKDRLPDAMRGLPYGARFRENGRRPRNDPPRTGSAVAWRIASRSTASGGSGGEGSRHPRRPHRFRRTEGPSFCRKCKPSGMPLMGASYALW